MSQELETKYLDPPNWDRAFMSDASGVSTRQGAGGEGPWYWNVCADAQETDH